MIVFLLMSLILKGLAFEGENEWRLKILNGYDKNIPPSNILNKDSDRGGIELGIMLVRLEDFSVSKGTLTLVGDLYQSWYDDRVRCDNSKCNHRRPFIGIDGDSLWKAQLRIFNSVKRTSGISQPFFVTTDGLIYSSNVAKTFTECTPTVEYFPFDKHTCQLVFGVMSSEGESIKMHSNADILLSDGDSWSRYLIENSKWKITSFKIYREYYKPLFNQDMKIPAKIITIKIERNCPLIALGVFTVALVSVVFGLLPFWLPPQTSFIALRLALGIVGLFTAFQTSDVIYKFAPAHHGQTPLIAKYCVVCSSLIVISLLETLLVSNLRRLNTKPSFFVEKVVGSSASNVILRFWGYISGHIQDDGRFHIIEDDEPMTNEKEVNWTTVTLLLDSLGFIFLTSTWIVFCLIFIAF